MGAFKSENPGSGSTLRCYGMSGQVADLISFLFMQFVTKQIAKQESIPVECALPTFPEGSFAQTPLWFWGGVLPNPSCRQIPLEVDSPLPRRQIPIPEADLPVNGMIDITLMSRGISVPYREILDPPLFVTV